MGYKELTTLYHMDTSASQKSNLHTEWKRRLEADSTFRLGYQTPQGELFIATPRELSILQEQVLRTERKVSKLANSIPGIAENAILRGLVLDEVVSTNAIESIRSTRRQIKNALEGGNNVNPGNRRFRELARLYMDIIDEKAAIPTAPADVRVLYDRVMDGELTPENQPDGELFRASGVTVSNGTKVLHIGLEPEGKIIEAIDAMLRIAQSGEIPALYGAIASHYLFEYAHPFYDGNGRTGRYLLALYLGVPLSMATSLSLSRTIYENKNIYYRAFSSAQSPLNRGELTHFVLAMMNLIRLAQNDMLERLEKANERFKKLQSEINEIESQNGLKKHEADILFMLMQYETFDYYGDASLPEIARYLQIGEQMARRYLKTLEERGAIERVRERNPITFALTEEFKRKYGVVPIKEAASLLTGH